MIIALGTDLVRIERIAAAIGRFGDRFLQRIFTDREVALCQVRAHAASACYAKRFAAKEAMAKALGTGMREGIWFRDMEVLSDAYGKPVMYTTAATAIRLQQLQVDRVHLSLSDEAGLAWAVVVLEQLGQGEGVIEF
ncbi:MAG: holo-ACP synthase [Magnetococcales bacterium]|nr:holo-ACP synthase [Magnetococcales bacterium]